MASIAVPEITPISPFLATSRANCHEEIRTPIPPWIIFGRVCFFDTMGAFSGLATVECIAVFAVVVVASLVRVAMMEGGTKAATPPTASTRMEIDVNDGERILMAVWFLRKCVSYTIAFYKEGNFYVVFTANSFFALRPMRVR